MPLFRIETAERIASDYFERYSPKWKRLAEEIVDELRGAYAEGRIDGMEEARRRPVLRKVR